MTNTGGASADLQTRISTPPNIDKWPRTILVWKEGSSPARVSLRRFRFAATQTSPRIRERLR